MIIGMMIVRNEENRWLKTVLKQYNKIVNKLIVYDDDSTDNTAQICLEHGATVYQTENRMWDKNEVNLRKKLWDKVIEIANNNDWILCLDADELLVDNHIPFLKYLFYSASNEVDGIGLKLHDFWNETQYRDDEYWKAHFYYWCMAIRYKKDKIYEWSDKPLHCGRFPLNASQRMFPTEIPIKHMGWSVYDDRIKKYIRYKTIDPNGENGWLAQYNSILDNNPNLKTFYEYK